MKIPYPTVSSRCPHQSSGNTLFKLEPVGPMNG